MKANVIKEQFNIERLVPDVERDLAADKGKAAAEFQKQIAEMDQEAALDLPLLRLAGDGEEIEVVRVFQDLLGQVGVRGRKRPLEVGDSLPFPLEKSALDLKYEDVAAPAILDGGVEVPLPLLPVFELVNQNPKMPKAKVPQTVALFQGRARPRQAAHIFEVAGAVAFDTGELPLEVPAEMIGAPGTPTLLLLACQDLTPNRLIEENQFPADGKGGPNQGGADVGFQLLEELGVSGGELEAFWGMATIQFHAAHGIIESTADSGVWAYTPIEQMAHILLSLGLSRSRSCRPPYGSQYD